MPIPLVLGGIAAAGSLFNMITGIGQNQKSKGFLGEYNQLQEQRPQYQTPEEAFRMLSLIEQQYADPTMPGQTQAVDRANQNFANTVQAGAQAGNPFAALAGAQAQADATSNNIATQAAGYQDQQRAQYMQALQMMSGYRDQEFQMNQFAPWADKTQMALNQYRDYRQAGNRNIASGIDGLSQIALAGMGFGNQSGGAGPDMSALQSIYQRYTTPPPSQSTNSFPPPY